MQKDKTVTVITGNYYPEDTAIGLYTTQFSRFLAMQGYEVKIITGFPNYPQWKIYPDYSKLPKFYSETVDEIEIIRYKQYVPTTVDFKGRVLMMLSLFYGTVLNIKRVKKTDLIICIVPFTISILPALLLSKFRKAKLWVHVQDFEFDLAFDSGVVKKDALFFRLFKNSIAFFERKMLNASAVVSSISYSMLTKIKEKSNQKEPYYFPNWVSAKKINPEISVRHPIITPDKFTLLYSGNIGEKQDWGFLEKLCLLITTHDNIEIVIVGDGGYKKVLFEKLSSYGFVRFYDPVPYAELNNLVCSAGAHFLFQKEEVVDTILPSKILAMMASGRPSLISGNKNSEVSTIINQSNGGRYFYENDVNQVYKTLLELKKNSRLCREMGINARNYILNHYSEEQILSNFHLKIKQVLS